MERTAWREGTAVVDASGEDGGEDGGALVLGRYRPLRPLGSGGSGSVWLVRDERSGNEVALKIVAREGKAGTRAEREAHAAARLRHPRCARALALHRDDGHVYAAYEYVHGKTLREALRSGELDDRASIEAAAQILEALAHAHAKGIVHRDVKPANVMVEATGDAVSVRLLDFGLAHIGDADTLTAVGDVPGTLAYIAPERLDGERATAAADVWSVGVVLWEALAGWHPFSAPSPVETARRIGAGAQPLARSRPDLPDGLCALVDRMLSLDPRRRPQARRLPDLLRAAVDERERAPSASSPRALADRIAPALLAASVAGGAAWLLPFFPRGWPLLLAVV
ncbi:MAG: serine/threonine protein kinase, partial [Actinobacteria bacterium]|nr:serine/threonine protein kinase [Actinomycetota bacterium]